MQKSTILSIISCEPKDGCGEYPCSKCQYEMKVKGTIINVKIATVEFEKRYYDGYMPVLDCSNCNKETMEYFED